MVRRAKKANSLLATRVGATDSQEQEIWESRCLLMHLLLGRELNCFCQKAQMGKIR